LLHSKGWFCNRIPTRTACSNSLRLFHSQSMWHQICDPI